MTHVWYTGILRHATRCDTCGCKPSSAQWVKGEAGSPYSITDYYMIDPRLGSNEEYCEMIDAAHGKNIKVVMDMIFNHSGSGHWWIEDIPDDDWFNQNDYAASIGQRAREQAQQHDGGAPPGAGVLQRVGPGLQRARKGQPGEHVQRSEQPHQQQTSARRAQDDPDGKRFFGSHAVLLSEIIPKGYSVGEEKRKAGTGNPVPALI